MEVITMEIKVLERNEKAEVPYELVQEIYENGTTRLACRPLVKKDSEDVPLYEQEVVKKPKKRSKKKKE